MGLFSKLTSQSQIQSDGTPFRRRFHVEPGVREKALLEEDPTLKKFKSNKADVRRIKKIGNALLVVVVIACSYEIYVKAGIQKSKFEEMQAKAGAGN
ncbi:hypothetical protein QJS10_CPA05g02152 [Acorus calamus]|uniref:Succinate dehydrogenase subunit 7A, mitochondrial n=1 Tax=Acorus calamus TaxID=4465 RepID=A0AAV9EVH4_ACOCL|nr:hypothetical protein QJS10_CPA05g02152 [Acorus calamus]